MKVYIDAYLARNLGDDLFVNILTNRYKNHKFLAISNGIKEYNLKNLKVLSNPYLFRILKKFELEKYVANRCDLVVSIGGSMYMENNDSTRDFSLGKNKHYILGINFGPYKTQEYYNNLYKVFEKAEDVCFREKYSYELFKNLPNVRYSSDIVFGMNTQNIKITNRKRAIISIISCKYKFGNDKYTENYEKKVIELIEFLLKKGYEICLMSFCKKEKDEEAIEQILNKLDEKTKNKVEKYYYNGNIEEAISVLADSSLIVGSRFHANIIGLVLGKTIIPIIYSSKVLNTLENIKTDIKTIDIREISKFDINEITDEDLIKKIDVKKQKEEAKKQFEKLDIALISQ